jgi:hypothetical protein
MAGSTSRDTIRPYSFARSPPAGTLDVGFARGYTFTVPIQQEAGGGEGRSGVPQERRQFSLLVGLRAVDGTALMWVWSH